MSALHPAHCSQCEALILERETERDALLVINLRLEEIQKVAVEALENVKHAVGNSKTLEGPLRKCIEALANIDRIKNDSVLAQLKGGG